MNNTINKTFKMRRQFKMPPLSIQNWFPGHMYAGMQKMKRKLTQIDCLIEVHDARIPLSGRNPNLDYKFSVVPRMLLLNKRDMIEPKMEKLIYNSLQDKGLDRTVIFTNCTDQKDDGIRQIIPQIIELLESKERRSETNLIHLMVAGVPNVGKSSLINVLRNTNLGKAKAAKEGSLAGVTRSVMEKIKIHDDPPLYLFDTPGITVPTLKDKEIIMKLGLCGTLEDKLIPVDVMADYLLYFLNKHRNFTYLEHLGLSEPCDDIREVLLRTAIHHEFKLKVKNFQKQWEWRPHFALAGQYFVACFRKGKFGKLCLDQDILY